MYLCLNNFTISPTEYYLSTVSNTSFVQLAVKTYLSLLLDVFHRFNETLFFPQDQTMS